MPNAVYCRPHSVRRVLGLALRYGEGAFLFRMPPTPQENTILKTPNSTGVEFKFGLSRT